MRSASARMKVDWTTIPARATFLKYGRIDLGRRADDQGFGHLAGDSPDFLMLPVADDDDPEAFRVELPGLGLDVLDHGAGRVDEFDAGSPDLLQPGGRDAVALDDENAVPGQAVIFDRRKAAAFQPGQDDLVMDDLSQEVDLRLRALDPKLLDDLDRPVDPAAESDIRRDVDDGRGFFYFPFSRIFLKFLADRSKRSQREYITDELPESKEVSWLCFRPSPFLQ